MFFFFKSIHQSKLILVMMAISINVEIGEVFRRKTQLKDRKSGKVFTSHCSQSQLLPLTEPASDGSNSSVRMTTQSVLLDFSIPDDRDIDQSKQIVEDFLNQHIKTLYEDFSGLKLELNITGKT